MIKQPLFRRGSQGQRCGIREKIVWQLSKRPMSCHDLAEILSVPAYVIRDNLNHGNLERCRSVNITAGAPFVNREGKRDRIYTMHGKPVRIVPDGPSRKQIFISKKSLSTRGNASREKYEEQAERRRRLIKAGLYITESDLIK